MKSQKSKVKSLKSEISNLKLRCCRWGAVLATIVVALGGATAARAQGCAMCYNTAAAAPTAAIQALRSGILVLLFPPLLMFLGILVLFLCRRNRFSEDEPGDAENLLRETGVLVGDRDEEPGMAPCDELEAPVTVSEAAWQ